jgi:pheromone a factor receptor
MPDYAFSVFSCIGFLLCIGPAYFNWKIPGRPWATLIVIGWIFALNLVAFIDSLIWSSEDSSHWWDGKIYCDISSRIKSEFPVGVPGATIGICRFLAEATNPNPSQTDLKHNTFKRNMIDLGLGVILPLIQVPLKYIVQPSRYYIIGVNGCSPRIDTSWPAIPIDFLWSPILSLIAAGYACMTPFSDGTDSRFVYSQLLYSSEAT